MSSGDDINELIIAAATTTSSPTSGRSLKDLYSLVAAAGVADSLDALRILSVLLPLKDPAARDLIAIIGECSSPKEVIMAVQEVVENFIDQAYDDDAEDGGGEGTETTTWVERLIELVELYRAAISKLKLRKKSASETLQPLLFDLRRAMELISFQIGSNEASVLTAAVGNMVDDVSKWVKDTPSIEPEEVAKCKVALKSLLDQTLTLFRHLLRYDAAQQALEVCFPRLRMPEREAISGDNEGSQIVEQYLSIYNDLGYPQSESTSLPSLVSVILLVYVCLKTSSCMLPSLLLSFSETLLSMLQPTSNLQNDATAFTLLALHQNDQAEVVLDLSTEVCLLLPPLVDLAGAHPSPSTRLQAFRAVSLLVPNSAPQLRFQLLTDLVAKCEYPQMRVAAVGLIKDAVLNSLSPRHGRAACAFGTSTFMTVLGPLLFRPSPPDLFESKLNIEDFLESPEPKRIIEVLSLYYVVLLRDKTNLTSIRDKDMLDTVEKNLLKPLETWLETVLDQGPALIGHDHSMMPLVSMRMGLNRVREAKESL